MAPRDPELACQPDGSCGTRIGMRSAAASALSAAGASYCGAGPLPGPCGANEHIPSIPASAIQATTSGAMDQNMSRPSCSSRSFAGRGTGTDWPSAAALGADSG